MSESEVIAVISLVGTLIGSGGGVLVANKLSNYRIQQLEIKVDKHNNFANRLPVVEEKLKVINHRLDDIEHKQGV